MKIKLHLSYLLLFICLKAIAQFPMTAENWNIPNVESAAMDMNYVSGGNYGLYDINGDGLLDLIDPKDNFTGTVWMNGVQRYWKVYVNNGTSISANAENWNVPNVESDEMDMTSVGNGFYGLIDINGDGNLDLVDSRDNFTGDVWANGAQRYWKVYVNNGSSFSPTAVEWNVPNVESNASDMNGISSAFYGLYDMNGDGKLDLVDSKDNFTNSVWLSGVQRYWKVYLNTGNTFSPSATQWNLPNVESAEMDMNAIGNGKFALVDINGDDKLDLIDAADNFTNEVWSNGAQRYWKVYTNSGTAFATSASNWNLPNVESNAADMSQVSSSFYGLYDMNGDNKLDLVDTKDNFSGSVWMNGAQRFWKVYTNSGTTFAASEIQWNVPNVESADMDMNVFVNSFYTPVDINGDGYLDLVDAKDNFTSNVWENGAQRYWKVYLNTLVGVGINELNNLSIAVYPNPSKHVFVVDLAEIPHADIIVTNNIGQIILEMKDISSKSYSLDLSDFSNGIYFMHLAADGKSYTAKLVKE